MNIILLLLMPITSLLPPIYWSEKKLEAKDFKPQVDLVAAATSSTGIMLIRKADGTSHAIAFFNKEESVIRASLTGNQLQRVLEHEQIHFDIAEWHTRELNKRLEGVNKVDALQLHSTYMHSLLAMQLTYDEQTEHSLNESQQARWRRLVDDLLSN